ncbi:MAG: methyl-accepting chemotaxis protein [Nitrospirae bacterium]|nr:methyl-accepting chemotaxis protein [Nitrospirota bacterium]
MNKETDALETVDKSYYNRFALKCTSIIIAGAVLAGIFLYFSLLREPGSSYAENYGIIAALRGDLLNKSAYLYIAALFFIIIGITIISLLYSHKVAGPLYRLDVYAGKVSSGDLTETVKLREKDAIYPLADDLNGLVSMCSEVIDSLETEAKEVSGISSAAAARPDEAGERETVEKISRRVYNMNRILSRIKL